jgi:hypothetical protein
VRHDDVEAVEMLDPLYCRPDIEKTETARKAWVEEPSMGNMRN